jgi:hypothetical protein
VFSIRSPNDVSAGALLILFALIGFWMTSDLRTGTALRMGPGYLPKGVSWCLLIIGGVSIVLGILRHGEPAESWRPRPLIFVILALAYFAFMIERLGLVIALLGLVLIGSLATSESRRWETALLAAGLTFFSVLIFVIALGLPLQLWPVEFR